MLCGGRGRMNECCVCVKAGRIDHPISEKCPAIECSDCGSYTHIMCLDRRMKWNRVRCRNCKSSNYCVVEK